jgi:hypothetical protein
MCVCSCIVFRFCHSVLYYYIETTSPYPVWHPCDSVCATTTLSVQFVARHSRLCLLVRLLCLLIRWLCLLVSCRHDQRNSMYVCRSSCRLRYRPAFSENISRPKERFVLLALCLHACMYRMMYVHTCMCLTLLEELNPDECVSCLLMPCLSKILCILPHNFVIAYTKSFLLWAYVEPFMLLV